MSSFEYIDRKKTDILNLGKGPTDDSDDNTLATKKEYSTNFTKQQKTFCLNLHYFRENS